MKASQLAPVARTGDVWLLGDHRLMCGDSTNSDDVARLMGSARANMSFTDPPYNVDYGNHGGAPRTGRRSTIVNDDLGEVFHQFLEKACHNILDVTDGAVYISMACAELHTLQKAFISAEDHRFYSHPGIDFMAVLRAVKSNLAEGRIVSGASTLTQQLSRMT